jgi:hypothetical protein
VAFALAFATLAVAKGFEVDVCGVSRCERLARGSPGALFATSSFGSWFPASPPQRAPYFELVAFSHGKEYGWVAYVPARRALWHSVNDTWSRVSPADNDRWRPLVRGIRPFRPSGRAAIRSGPWR